MVVGKAVHVDWLHYRKHGAEKVLPDYPRLRTKSGQL